MTDENNWHPVDPQSGSEPPPPQPTPEGQQWQQPAYGQYAPGGYGYGYGGGQGWAPPPKPGLIPLRPLSFGQLLGAPFQVLRHNPKATFGSALLIQAAVLVVTILTVGTVTAIAVGRIASAQTGDEDAVTAGAVTSILLSYLIPVALSIVGGALLQGVIVYEVARATVGEKLTLRALWRLARPRMWALVRWTLLLIAAVAVAVAILGGAVTGLVLLGSIGILFGVLVGIFGFLGCLVLAVWLYTKTSLVPSVVVLESTTVRAGIARSWSLTKGNFWRTFGVLILITIIVNIVAQIVITPISLIFSFVTVLIDPNGAGDINGGAIVGAIVIYGVIILVSLVIGAITSIVQSSAAALIYIDLRMRKEGLDIELTRYVEAVNAGTEASDPYARAAQ